MPKSPDKKRQIRINWWKTFKITLALAAGVPFIVHYAGKHRLAAGAWVVTLLGLHLFYEYKTRNEQATVKRTILSIVAAAMLVGLYFLPLLPAKYTLFVVLWVVIIVIPLVVFLYWDNLLLWWYSRKSSKK